MKKINYRRVVALCDAPAIGCMKHCEHYKEGYDKDMERVICAHFDLDLVDSEICKLENPTPCT